MVFASGIYETKAKKMSWQKNDVLEQLWKKWKFLGQRRANYNLEDESRDQLVVLDEQKTSTTPLTTTESPESGTGPIISEIPTCLKCICLVESGCQQVPCGLPGAPCGPFQIDQRYWIEGGRKGGNWQNCVQNFQCAEDTVRGYMQRWATPQRLRRVPTCEDYARIHDGGPDGPFSRSTLAYWQDIQDQGCDESSKFD